MTMIKIGPWLHPVLCVVKISIGPILVRISGSKIKKNNSYGLCNLVAKLNHHLSNGRGRKEGIGLILVSTDTLINPCKHVSQINDVTHFYHLVFPTALG